MSEKITNCVYCKRELTTDKNKVGMGYIVDEGDVICEHCDATKRARTIISSIGTGLVKYREIARNSKHIENPVAYLESKLEKVVKPRWLKFHTELVNIEAYPYWMDILKKEVDDKSAEFIYIEKESKPGSSKNTNY